MSSPPDFNKLRELAQAKLAALRNANKPLVQTAVEVKALPQEPTIQLTPSIVQEMVWNKEQQEFLDFADTGEDCCLIGKAGTGKTTVTREGVKRAMSSGRIGPLATSTKFLREGAPGVVVVSFTNRAVKNIARGMPKDLQGNCLTVHKLLEFQPTPYEYKDSEGNWKTSMRFEPARTKFNPLPTTLKCIIFEESSMISVELWKQLMEALPHKVQMIYLGDLQQLPPVYGSAILGFKLLEHKVIELTEIYRQAADSPIISLAWEIASGKPIIPQVKDEVTTTKDGKQIKSKVQHFDHKNIPGKLNIRPFKKRLDSDDALHIISKLFKNLFDNGEYSPMEDMIMIPFNKQFGTTELNKNIANFLGKHRKAQVYEIIAGFQKHYYAVGDKVMVEKQEAIIEEIVINGRFVSSVVPLSPSDNLNRWGMYNMDEGDVHIEESNEKSLEDVENFLALTMSSQKGDEDEVRQQASHIIKCRVIGASPEDPVIEISTAGEYSATSFAYALTVHKCQGSEWKKCFLILHRSHAVMLSRELLYTAVTRARESLYILCEPDSLTKGVTTQRIKGNSIAEKAEYFKGKIQEMKGGW